MVAALAQKHTGPGMEAGPLCPSLRPRPSFQVPRPRPPPPRPGHPPALFLEQTHSVFLCLFKLVAFRPLSLISMNMTHEGLGRAFSVPAMEPSIVYDRALGREAWQRCGGEQSSAGTGTGALQGRRSPELHPAGICKRQSVIPYRKGTLGPFRLAEPPLRTEQGTR